MVTSRTGTLYSQGSEGDLRFVQGINGKPDLDPDGKFPDIRFSLSRTDEMVCLALTRKSEIGVDIVRPQNHYSFSAIGHYLFTPGERKWVAQTIPGRRSMRFFKVWALKEALLKATGGDVRTMKEADVSPYYDRYIPGRFLSRVNRGRRIKDVLYPRVGLWYGASPGYCSAP